MRLAGSTAARVCGVAIAMLVVAALAVWVLAPDGQLPDPLPVAASDYFNEAQLRRAEDFRAGQRWLMIAGLAIEAAVLLAAALGRPAWLRDGLERLGARPLGGAAVAGAAVAALVALATVPTALIAHERAVDAGLSTQSLGSWAWDLCRSTAITAALAALGAALLLALVRTIPPPLVAAGRGAAERARGRLRLDCPGRPGAGLQRVRAAPRGKPIEARVLALGERAGVDIGEVYSIERAGG